MFDDEKFEGVLNTHSVRQIIDMLYGRALNDHRKASLILTHYYPHKYVCEEYLRGQDRALVKALRADSRVESIWIQPIIVKKLWE